MKRFWCLLVLALPLAAQASDQGDLDVIRTCLNKWDHAPFKRENPEFRVLSAGVKVFGIGKGIHDDVVTEKPALILVKSAVSVLGKNEVRLMNPHGWYCLKGRVAVLGKAEVVAHCKAHLASSGDGAAVLGSNEEKGGTAVLGAARIRLEGCGG